MKPLAAIHILAVRCLVHLDLGAGLCAGRMELHSCPGYAAQAGSSAGAGIWNPSPLAVTAAAVSPHCALPEKIAWTPPSNYPSAGLALACPNTAGNTLCESFQDTSPGSISWLTFLLPVPSVLVPCVAPLPLPLPLLLHQS